MLINFVDFQPIFLPDMISQHELLRLLIYNPQDVMYIVNILKISVEAIVLNFDLPNYGKWKWSLGKLGVQEAYIGHLFTWMQNNLDPQVPVVWENKGFVNV